MHSDGVALLTSQNGVPYGLNISVLNETDVSKCRETARLDRS